METWATAFEDNLNDFQIPDFELFYCPSEDEVNFEEFALYSYILLETREELYTEFKDELDFIKKHFPGIEVNTTQISDGGKSYFILANTPIMEL